MKELLLEFLRNILEAEESLKAVKTDSDGERVVVFKSKENMDKKITSPPKNGVTYRPYNPNTDANLKTDGEADVDQTITQPKQTKTVVQSMGANEVFGTILAPTREVSPGINARPIRDPVTGDEVDVRTDDGRTRAVEIIDEQLKQIDPKLKEILQKVSRRERVEGQNIHKWLGNAGELYAFRELLASGTAAAYLLPDSNVENDIVVVRENGDRGVNISEISVKSSAGEVVGSLGSNARKSLYSAVDGKSYDVNGQSYDAKDVIDISMLVYIQMTRFVSEGLIQGKQRRIEVPEKQRNKFIPEKLVAAEEMSRSGDRAARKGSQTEFLSARIINNDDIDGLETKLSSLDTSPEKKELIAHFIDDLRIAADADQVTALDLRKIFTEQIKHILTDTKSSLNFDSDLASVKFTESAFSSVTITPAEIVRQRASGAAGVEDVSQITVDKQLEISKFRLSTRGLPPGYLGAIINMAPPYRILKSEDKLSPKDYIARIP